jgi:hypothetical protein
MMAILWFESGIHRVHRVERRCIMTNGKKENPRDPWLSVFCPDDACLTEEEYLSLASSWKAHDERRGAWLEVFCPDDRCTAETPTKLV